jgi:hypothetical protein
MRVRLQFGAAVLVAALALLLAGSNARAGFMYKLDDGSSEQAITLTNGGDVIWLNQFTADPSNNVITSISVAFGTPTAPNSPSLNGTSIMLALWESPTNSTDPTTAVLLTTASGVVANDSTDIFNTYNITPTAVSGSFFVGVEITVPAVGQSGPFPTSEDTDNPQGRSWFAGATAGMGNLNNLAANNVFPVETVDSLGFPGNWLIRANGQPAVTAVPAPLSAILLGIGALGLLGYAWRRRKSATA